MKKILLFLSLALFQVTAHASSNWCALLIPVPGEGRDRIFDQVGEMKMTEQPDGSFLSETYNGTTVKVSTPRNNVLPMTIVGPTPNLAVVVGQDRQSWWPSTIDSRELWTDVPFHGNSGVQQVLMPLEKLLSSEYVKLQCYFAPQAHSS